jgi:hypothetical protein
LCHYVAPSGEEYFEWLKTGEDGISQMANFVTEKIEVEYSHLSRAEFQVFMVPLVRRIVDTMHAFDHNIKCAKATDGLHRARLRGVIVGRPSRKGELDLDLLIRMREEDGFSWRALGKYFKMSHMTLVNIYNREKQKRSDAAALSKGLTDEETVSRIRKMHNLGFSLETIQKEIGLPLEKKHIAGVI